MTPGRLAALKPWTTPLALSLAVHGAIVALALGLGALFVPPRPDAVIPVELVFASGSSSAAKASAPSDHAAPAPPSPSFPHKQDSSDAGSPLHQGQQDKCIDARGSCIKPAEPPAQNVAASAKPAARAEALLPDRAPLPPVRNRVPKSARDALTAAQRRAADDAIARMLDDAAAKMAPPIANASVSPPTPALPQRGGGNAPREPFSPHSPLTGEGGGGATYGPSEREAVSRSAALVPPGWGRPGLGNSPPVYPLAARRSGAEGRVVLRVRVDAAGHVETVDIARSSGHDLLDEAARRAVAEWRFVPGRLAGMPVAASVEIPVVFRLKE